MGIRWFVAGHKRGPNRGKADAEERKGRDEERNEHDEHHARREGQVVVSSREKEEQKRGRMNCPRRAVQSSYVITRCGFLIALLMPHIHYDRLALSLS